MVKPIEKEEKLERWEYKMHKFPNGMKSYWIKFKQYPDDERFFSRPKTLIVKFDKELDKVGNEHIASLNEWRITKLSYSTYLPKMCEELNFFESIYDTEGELIAALFAIKWMIDSDNISYTMKNFDAFRDLCYKLLFTPSMKEKITRMVEENYADDIETENVNNLKNPDIISIMQRKKKSLEFKNEHVKALLMISFGIKMLSPIISHFAVMRNINIRDNIMIFYDFYLPMFGVFDFDFNIYNKVYAYIENKVNSSLNFNRSIFEQQEVEGKDKSIIVGQIMARNIIIDNLVKFSLPKTWNSVKQQPNERVLSFICSIVNTHISIFTIQVFRRNIVEMTPIVDADGSTKSDRFRASKMKMNEEYAVACTMDMRQLVNQLFDRYKNDITAEEIDYYRKNMQKSRLQQLMIEIYFFNYTSSSQEFLLLSDYDWYRLLLVMRKDIMTRLNVTKDTLLDSMLTMILTANIEEVPVGEKVYVKDTKFLEDNKSYKTLVKKYYSTIMDIDPDAIKKLLITFANSKYKFVLYEEPDLLNQDISIDKRDLMESMLDFLLLSNSTITLEDMVTE